MAKDSEGQWWIIFERRYCRNDPLAYPTGFEEVGELNGTIGEAHRYAEVNSVNDSSIREVMLVPKDMVIQVRKADRIKHAIQNLMGGDKK